MQTVDILLATYNGAAYLEVQLDSILSQEFQDWHIFVRDDGSTDETPEILNRYVTRHNEKITLIQDKPGNLGPARNFSALLQHSKSNYIMFCDQDDYWHPDKIGKTLAFMQATEAEYKNCPLLVHSDLHVVDQNLRPIFGSFWQYQGLQADRNKLADLLVQNNVTGCAMMINALLRSKVLSLPGEAIMHDWWYALVASAFGQVIPLHEILIDYRQHEKNDTGAKRYNYGYILRHLLNSFSQQRILNFHKQLKKTQQQAAAFLNYYGKELPDAMYLLVDTYSRLDELGWIKRRWFLIRHGLLKHGFFRSVAMLCFI